MERPTVLAEVPTATALRVLATSVHTSAFIAEAEAALFARIIIAPLVVVVVNHLTTCSTAARADISHVSTSLAA